jgi:DNA gyrase/topoisomerase IV subunit A
MNLKELYQEIILDHGKNPRNLRKTENFNKDAKGHNPLCGDKVHIFLKLNDNKKLEDISFEGQGVIALKTSDRNGNMVSAVAVDENDGIMLISDKGTLIRTAISQIPTLGRNTQGVKVISPKDGEKLIEGVRIPPEEEEE